MIAPAAERFLKDKALACVHCGLCLGACPTYLETGDENDSPRGRIYLMRALEEERMPLAESAVRHIDLCLGCRACEAACPSGVAYGNLLESTRDHIERSYRRSLFQRWLRHWAIETILPHPRRLEAALRPARALRWARLDRVLPRLARQALSLVPERSDTFSLPEISPVSTTEKRGQVGLISGCVMSVLFQETNAATVRLLNGLGYEVVTPLAQVCCGALYAHGGNLAAARECARRNIAVFERLELEAIATNAAGCGSTLKEYGHLLEGDALWAAKAKVFSGKVRDLSEFLAGEKPSPAGWPNNRRVTFHDACHLAHAQRIAKEPRALVRSVAGRQFVELPESDLCCGSAGSYNLTEPEMANRLQNRKIENILRTGADVVVTTNPGCLLQIRAGLAKAGKEKQIQVLHLADFLWAARADARR